MIKLSYGWSINQTMVLTGAVTGDQYANDGAWLIQLAPQALLAVAGIAMMKKQNRLSMVLIVFAVVVNILDAYTNIIAFRELWPQYQVELVQIGRSQQFIDATRTVGYTVSFLVTWFEEAIMLCIGTAMIIFVELAEEMRWNLPPFFRAFGTITSAAGGNFSQAKRASQNGHTNNMATSARSDRSYRDNVTYSTPESNYSVPERPDRVRN